MKTILIAFVGGLLLSTSMPPAMHTAKKAATTYVYICNGKYSKKYHLKEDCPGLNNCSTKVEKVTLEQARKKGRTLCKFED